MRENVTQAAKHKHTLRTTCTTAAPHTVHIAPPILLPPTPRQCKLVTMLALSALLPSLLPTCLLPLTLLALANCDASFSRAAALATVSASAVATLLTPLAIAGGAAAAVAATQTPLLGAIHTGNYSSRTVATTNAAVQQAINTQAADRHRAAFNYRIKHRPQQFYANKALAPAVHSPFGLHSGAAVDIDRKLSSRSLISVRMDICQEHCMCARDNNFIKIRCDYQQNRKLSEIFDSNFQLPTNANAITIKLAQKTHFRLDRGFFSQTKINSFIIEGSHSDGEQVELNTGAFADSNGPYPDIQMRNVFSVVVRERAFTASGKFTVRNSNDLILYANAFEKSELNGLFVGIDDLRIEEKAFNTAKAKLRIESSHIDNIYRFEASLREIRFINSTIGTINGGTFDVNTINSIIFEDCHIDVIKARAITEKLFSEHVSITGGVIGSIEGEAIYGSGINALILTNNKIDTISENAIHVNAINATIAHNRIKHLGNNWLRVKEWSNIVVEKNQFGEFGRIVIEDTKQPMICRFDSNSLTRPLPGSLNITNPHCTLREIAVDLPCRCDLAWLQELSEHDLRSETYCTIDDALGHCFNASTFNTLKYLNEVCDDQKDTIDCGANSKLKKVDGNFLTPEELELRNKNSMLPYYIAASIIAVILIAILAVVAARQCNRKQRSHRHEFSEADHEALQHGLLHIQEKYPKIHHQVDKHVKKLRQRDLSYEKCENCIIKIESLINKQKCDDLKTFQNVLVRHLQQSPTAPPPESIYPENVFTASGEDEGGFYASNSVVQLRRGQYDNAPPNMGNEQHMRSDEPPELPARSYNQSKEPIYEPLLDNDYSSPADHNADNSNLYAVPVDERDMHLPAYAVSAQLCSPQYAQPVQKPSTSPKPPPTVPSTTRAPHPPVVFNQSHKHHNSHATPLLLTATINNNNNNNNNNSYNNKNGRSKLTNVQQIAHGIEMMPNFSLQRPRNLPLGPPPIYSDANKSHKQQRRVAVMPTLASPEADDCELDMRGAMALPPDAGSNHSGGSNETVKIDDVIEYADA